MDAWSWSNEIRDTVDDDSVGRELAFDAQLSFVPNRCHITPVELHFDRSLFLLLLPLALVKLVFITLELATDAA